MKRSFFYIFLSAFLLLGLSGCLPTRHLKDKEKWLYQQKLKGQETVDEEELQVFLQQKPNRRILYLPIMPYVSAYYWGKKSWQKKIPKWEKKLLRTQEDYLEIIQQDDYGSEKRRKKIQKQAQKKNNKIKELENKIENGNWLMRSVGEPPVLYDSLLAEKTARQMKRFLQQRGYFDARIIPERRHGKRRVWLTYQVQEGEQHFVDSLRYFVPDSTLHALLVQDSSASLISKGKRYDEQKLGQERDRIYELFREKGYYYFEKKYIYFDIDTFNTDYNGVSIRLYVDNPKEGEHRRFFINNVRVFANQGEKPLRVEDSFGGIQYQLFRRFYYPKTLGRRIHLHKGEAYSQKNAVQTQRSLAALSTFKFINFKFDTLQNNKLDASIFLKSYPKYDLSFEGGVNVNITQTVPGPFLSASITDRNVFGGCEILRLDMRGLVELQTGLGVREGDVLTRRAREAGANLSLQIPKIFFPLPKTWRKKASRLQPQTLFRLGANYAYRPEYERFMAQGLVRFSWTNNKNTNYRLNLYDINLNTTSQLSGLFQEYLEELAVNGNTLLFSFSNSLVNSVSFEYTYNTNLFGTERRGKYLQIFTEAGNSLVSNLLGVGFIGNFIAQSDTLPPFEFLKGRVDYRRYFPLTERSSLAMRVQLGAAYPFGRGEVRGLLPYEKYFFAGGSNSVRAWPPRRLGPGSYTPNANDEGIPDLRFEQPGELLFECSIELRQHLLSVIDGALFMDAGNVWMLNRDTREGAQFGNDFWREVGLGAGFGLRLDFSFLIVRTDLAFKLHDPALPLGRRWFGRPINLRQPFAGTGASMLNIAVGYPF
jgi:outer membrane protein assembly factor BamA